MSDGDLSIGQLFGFLAPRGSWRTGVPVWPPDAFALAASALNASEVYFKVLEDDWPPHLSRTSRWPDYIYQLGMEWRNGVSEGKVPRQIQAWWRAILSGTGVSLGRVCDTKHKALSEALLQISATADQASAGFGIPGRSAPEIEYHALLRLFASNLEKRGATLCKEISAARIRVLPKLHTPQRGLTVRSMSHNLALCSPQIFARWYALRIPELVSRRHSLNILLVPWPKEVQPRQFSAVSHVPRSRGSSGLFTYSHHKHRLREELDGLLKRASDVVGPIDAIIMPELALDEDAATELKDVLASDDHSLKFAIAGVGKAAQKGQLGTNKVLFLLNNRDRPGSRVLTTSEQSKSHRWKIEKSQIHQYGLGSQLDVERDWWEAISLGKRSLSFYSMCPWLTMSVVICEDLARAEPVGSVLHSVGPNLVVALLMDGPQLRSRWSARYATVLAEDPGSSVLTLTCFGLAALSRPSGQTPKRVVALWKDAVSGDATEIELSREFDAAVLTVNRQFVEEWSADGRTDRRTTAYLTLGGVHPIAKTG